MERRMKEFSRRSVLSSVATLPALAIQPWVHSSETEKLTGCLEEGNAISPLCEARIKPSIAVANGLRWFRL
jgi:hypothetical protein